MNRKRNIAVLLLIFAAVLSSGCGKKQPDFQPPQVKNYTLKDISEVDFSEFNTGDGTELATQFDSLNWSPKGNYTYVLDRNPPADQYFSVLIRVESCDFTKALAGITYVLTPGEQDAVPVLSNGIIKCPMQVIDDETGIRHIVIKIDEALTLKFEGTKESFSAVFVNNGVSYTLKREG